MTALYAIGDFVETVERPVAVAVRTPRCHYMLRLHPNREQKAERQLNERGVSAYVPKETRSVKSVWGRRVLRTIPLFSGILFVADYDADLARLKSIADGIGGFVKRDGQALAIGPYWMGKIRSFEAKMAEDSLKRRMFHLDQKVRIIGGHFDMWEGKIARLDSHHRLSVLLSIFEREVPVEFDEDQVEAV